MVRAIHFRPAHVSGASRWNGRPDEREKSLDDGVGSCRRADPDGVWERLEGGQPQHQPNQQYERGKRRGHHDQGVDDDESWRRPRRRRWANALPVREGSGTTSACTGGCAAVWPVLSAAGTVTASTGVDAAKLGSAHGQVTYNGHLLYYFSGDAAPGDMKGVDIEEWYPVTPDGGSAEPK